MNIRICGLFLLLFAYAFSALLGADFVFWDDRALLTHDPAIAAFDLRGIFFDLSKGGYFPLTRLSLALDASLFGLRAPWSHGENILLHLCNTILVYQVTRRVFLLLPFKAMIAAGLFALHPGNVEAVAWVSGGRKELLCTAFFLITLLTGQIASGVAALLSKAMAVTLVPWLWWQQPKRLFTNIVLTVIAVGVGLLELKTQRTSDNMAFENWTLAQALARTGENFLFAISRAIFPRHLSVYYDRALLSLDWIDGIVLAIFCALLAWNWKQKKIRAPLVFFVLTLLPVLKLVPFGQDSAFNDRYLYLPGVGFFALSVLLLKELKWGWLVPLTLCAGLSRAQTFAWHNQETLWLNVLEKFPTSRKASANLLLYYISVDRLNDAIPYAARAIAEDPTNPEPRSNVGVLLTRLHRLRDAEGVLRDAIERFPQDANLQNNLGYVYLELKDAAKARAAFSRALALAPGFANAQSGLAKVLELEK